MLKIVQDAGIPMHCLEIEITESEAISSAMKTIEILNDLRRTGFRISIDDFGMGHTSLRYLREMPVDKVKIDRSLTLESSNGVNRYIVSSILGLCKKIDLKVVIEGVETAGQIESFKKMGADCFQGYYFSRPVSSEDCLKFMQEWNRSSEEKE